MLKVKRLVEDAILPVKAHKQDAGYDIFAIQDYIIPANSRVTIQTGIAIEIPNLGKQNQDIYVRIAPRSGLAVKNGLHVLAGVIDRGYIGEIMVPLLNTSNEDYEVKKGDKIAQMIPTYIYSGDIYEVSELRNTERNSNGIGSTGN
jgi:dUTP pyrophosphatase